MSPPLPVTIIIVSYHSREVLPACLDSVRAAGQAPVVVVDNASGDGTPAMVQERFPEVTLMANPQNLGFAAACNQGARAAPTEYLLFLNPDTRLLPDSLTQPLEFLQDPRHQSTGIVGIQLLDDHGRISRSCARFPTPGRFYARSLGLDRLLPRWFPSYRMTDWDHSRSQPVDHVIGAFYLVRRKVFEQLGGFDERFFVYLEDLDLSFRAHQAGWPCYYLAEAQAYHAGGGGATAVTADRLCYSLQSRLRYAAKHFHRWSALGITLATLLVEPALRLLAALCAGSFQQVSETCRAYARLWRAVRVRSSHSPS